MVAAPELALASAAETSAVAMTPLQIATLKHETRSMDLPLERGADPRLLSEEGKDELADTAHAFNVMSDRLEQERQARETAMAEIRQLASFQQAVLARYPQGDTKLRILIIRYPTANKAYSAYGNFIAAYLPEGEVPGPVKTEDGLWTRAEYFRNQVVMVFGAKESSEADRWVQTVVKKIKEDPS